MTRMQLGWHAQMLPIQSVEGVRAQRWPHDRDDCDEHHNGDGNDNGTITHVEHADPASHK